MWGKLINPHDHPVRGASAPIFQMSTLRLSDVGLAARSPTANVHQPWGSHREYLTSQKCLSFLWLLAWQHLERFPSPPGSQ